MLQAVQGDKLQLARERALHLGGGLGVQALDVALEHGLLPHGVRLLALGLQLPLALLQGMLQPPPPACSPLGCHLEQLRKSSGALRP